MTDKDRIEKIMQLEQMTSAQFASEIGIQNSTLSHIVNGRNNPSLDVLKKILTRYPQISSDWLILGSGTMFRDELKSQSLSLFDNIDLNNEISSIYTKNNSQNSGSSFTHKENEMQKSKENLHTVDSNIATREVNLLEEEKFVHLKEQTDKTVKKIILYYNDNTFQEFESK